VASSGEHVRRSAAAPGTAGDTATSHSGCDEGVMAAVAAQAPAYRMGLRQVSKAMLNVKDVSQVEFVHCVFLIVRLAGASLMSQ